jgi:hypothetical protein
MAFQMWTRPAGPGNFGEGREYQIVRYTDRERERERGTAENKEIDRGKFK